MAGKGGAAPYRKGAAFEREVQRDLQDKGWFVVRSPASHSEIDLLAVEPDSKWFIQCKMRKSGMSVAERKSLHDLADKYLGDAILAYKEDGKIVYAYINHRGELVA